MIYVVGPKTGGPHKIGTTGGSIEKRLSGLQTGSPVELAVVLEGEGGRELERQLHDKFEHRRVRGEWFNLSKDDLKEIELILLGTSSSCGAYFVEQTVSIKQIVMGKKAITSKFLAQLPTADIRVIKGVLWGWWNVPGCSSCYNKQDIHFLFENSGTLFRQIAYNPRGPQQNRHTFTQNQWETVLASEQFFI